MVRIDAKAGTGTLVGKLAVESTNGEWQDITCELTTPVTGQHDLYFTFNCSSTCNLAFDSWQFGKSATGIQKVETPKTKNEGYYDLQGRKVNNPTHGIYIKNGEKELRK